MKNQFKRLGTLNNNVPAYGESIARAYECLARNMDYQSEFYQAAETYRKADYWWRHAAACSNGHKRTERYRQAAAKCWESAQEFYQRYENQKLRQSG